MSTQVIMPQLGESVVEGTVSKWLKAEGQPISEFEPLLEINTDKVDTEIPAPASGILLRVFIAEGQTVQAGTILGVIGEAGEPVPEAPPASTAAHPTSPRPAVAEMPSPAPEPVREPAPAAASARPDLGFISPVVAKIAAEHRIDLSLVKGSGAGGRITKKDVLAYVGSIPAAVPAWEQPASGELFRPSEEVFGGPPKAGPAPGDVIPHNAVRRQIAEHMIRSRRTSPHVTTVMEADLSRVVAHRQAHKEIFARDGVDLTYSAYFVIASVAALKAVPWVNASWTDEGVVLHRQVHVGMAVSLGDEGLIVPVIKNADQLSLLAVAAAIKDLANRARSRKLKPDDVQGGTFTITNHGVSGSLFATPIINQPQAAILGVGKMQKRVVVIESPGDDAFAIRPMAYLTLTFDHRMLDGAVADRFLSVVVERLETWS
ncbi:MAG TPA: dihydrolipoamide acetyltransferase family protein [Anaerolineales bacterium]|nr:dihydrolipoamide acetyltransferase family protein [Anaerolineales bacterium]